MLIISYIKFNSEVTPYSMCKCYAITGWLMAAG